MPKIFSEKERETLQTELLDYGLQELEHRRYKDISIEELSAEAGIAKGTFYSFFDSKEAFFYEIMQIIKERNRAGLNALLAEEAPTYGTVADCIYDRYTGLRTLFTYFTPGDIKMIIRRVENYEETNDSEAFAERVLLHLTGHRDAAKARVVVTLFNMLSVVESGRDLWDDADYQAAVRVLADAVADYMMKKEEP